MEQNFTDILQQAKAQSLAKKDTLDANDIKVLKDARQKLWNEQSKILDERKRVREEHNLSLFGFAKSEQGQKFDAQYGPRLLELKKAIEELSAPIREFEDREKEAKRRQSETLEEKQTRRTELVEQRKAITREQNKLQRVISQLGFDWQITQKEIESRLKDQPNGDLLDTDEWKDYRNNLKLARGALKEFDDKHEPMLAEINREIELLDTEIEAYKNNAEYVQYHKELAASGLSEADFRRKQIIGAYGTTTNPHLAGYIFPDGKMLKMGNDNYRGEDHRLVREFFEPGSKEFDNAEASLWAFVAEGNIRWMPEGSGISIDANCPMTRDQKMTLYDIVDYAKDKHGKFYMDVVNGNDIKSFKYEGKQMSVAKITKDFNECRAEMTNQKPKQKEEER